MIRDESEDQSLVGSIDCIVLARFWGGCRTETEDETRAWHGLVSSVPSKCRAKKAFRSWSCCGMQRLCVRVVHRRLRRNEEGLQLRSS